MKTAKLFRNGQSQAVRLPKEFRFKGKEVFIRKAGSAVVLFPATGGWGGLRESIGSFSADFMKSREQPPTQRRGKDPFR